MRGLSCSSYFEYPEFPLLKDGRWDMAKESAFVPFLHMQDDWRNKAEGQAEVKLWSLIGRWTKFTIPNYAITHFGSFKTATPSRVKLISLGSERTLMSQHLFRQRGNSVGRTNHKLADQKHDPDTLRWVSLRNAGFDIGGNSQVKWQPRYLSNSTSSFK